VYVVRRAAANYQFGLIVFYNSVNITIKLGFDIGRDQMQSVLRGEHNMREHFDKRLRHILFVAYSDARSFCPGA
jgi:hypothetical protein